MGNLKNMGGAVIFNSIIDFNFLKSLFEKILHGETTITTKTTLLNMCRAFGIHIHRKWLITKIDKELKK